MLSLIFGMVAALCWGVHDVCVRFVAARSGPATAFLCVLVIGAIALAPLTLAAGGWAAIGARPLTLAVLAGFAYALGGYALYRAFEIGPVRLVAPLIGAYPVLSVLWATAQGTVPTPGQIIAVLLIVAGVGLNAMLSEGHDAEESGGAATPRTLPALLWSLAASVGFALTFAFGQAASAGDESLPLILIPRLSAFVLLLAGTLLFNRSALTLRGAPLGLLTLMGLCDATALGLVQWAGTLPRPEFAAVASSTFGMITIVLAAIFLRERMAPAQWGAVAMVFAAIGYLAL